MRFLSTCVLGLVLLAGGGRCQLPPKQVTQFVLSSDGDNLLLAEERVVCKYDQSISFVFHSEGAIALETNGKTYGGRLQVADPTLATAGLFIENDGQLVVKDAEDNDIWHTPEIPTGIQGAPYVLTVDIDRRARIRDGNDEIVWSFPENRVNILNLQSERMNFLRSGEKLVSPNGKYSLTITRRGELISNEGIQFNSVPASVAVDPRVLVLEQNGTLNLYDSKKVVKWTAAPKITNDTVGSFVVEVSDQGFLTIIDGNAIVIYNADLKRPATTATRTTSTTSSIRTTSTTTTPIATQTPTSIPPPSTTGAPPTPAPTRPPTCISAAAAQSECVYTANQYGIDPYYSWDKAENRPDVQQRWSDLDCNCYIAGDWYDVVPFQNWGTLSEEHQASWNVEGCTCRWAQFKYGITANSFGSAPSEVRQQWTKWCSFKEYCF